MIIFSSDAVAKSSHLYLLLLVAHQKPLLWDEAFKNMNDPSGRSISNIHNESYE